MSKTPATCLRSPAATEDDGGHGASVGRRRREAWEGFMRFSVRGYLSSALLGALLVAQSLALLVPTIAGGKGGVPPPSPGLPVLSSVSFTPAIVPGGSPATGTVKFGSVTDGAQSSRCSTVI